MSSVSKAAAAQISTPVSTPRATAQAIRNFSGGDASPVMEMFAGGNMRSDGDGLYFGEDFRNSKDRQQGQQNNYYAPTSRINLNNVSTDGFISAFEMSDSEKGKAGSGFTGSDRETAATPPFPAYVAKAARTYELNTKIVNAEPTGIGQSMNVRL